MKPEPQITPMLGMLRHMAAYARAKKTDPHCAVGIPEKVYLIWSSRSDSELQLLDRDLINLARQDETWLSIQLHCTSNHKALTSSAQTLTAEPKPPRVDEGEALLTAQLSSSDSSNLPAETLPGTPRHARVSEPGRSGCLPSYQLQHASQQRALVSYGFGNLHWAAAHVISMAGAFCAGVAVYGFRAANDVPGWQVGFLLFLATCVMTAGAASLVILPMHLYRYWHEGQKAHHKGPACYAAFQPVPFDSDEPVNQKVSHLEAQDNIEVIRSRPDADSVLRNVLAAHSHIVEISVFVAGPQALYANIKDVCADINKGPAQQGKPYLSVHRQAYNL